MQTSEELIKELTCLCNDVTQSGIRFCADHHKYHIGTKRLASVSSVISRMLPTDYSMIDPAVLENARIRGSLVDHYFCEYLRTGNVTVPANERQDVVDRLNMLIPWWDRRGLDEVTQVQGTVFSEVDGVAGTFDLGAMPRVLDLKCVSSLQPSYALQLGAYLTYGGFDEAAILHLTKDRVRLVKYDAETCKRQWQAIVAAWKVVQELETTTANRK